MAQLGLSQPEVCRFGIDLLDETLGGGIPRGSVIILEDEIGVENEHLLIQFLAEGLRSGDFGYVLSTERLYDDYRSLLVTFDIDEIVVETRRLVFLDGFSNPFGYQDMRQAGGASGEGYVRDLSQPREIADTIRRALLHVRQQAIRGVVDSFSTILLVSDSLKPPLSFLQHKIATDKQRGTTSLLTLHRDAHKPEVVRAIEHYADGVLSLSCTDAKHDGILEIKKMKGLNLSRIPYRAFWYDPQPGKIVITPIE
ncbi:MAG: RAD55 family ATPase [Candidatus Hodarchaeales archaeon]|jgi:KaiC/GvpD/RAD55 family RecA-like ATPase